MIRNSNSHCTHGCATRASAGSSKHFARITTSHPPSSTIALRLGPKKTGYWEIDHEPTSTCLTKYSTRPPRNSNISKILVASTAISSTLADPSTTYSIAWPPLFPSSIAASMHSWTRERNHVVVGVSEDHHIQHHLVYPVVFAARPIEFVSTTTLYPVTCSRRRWYSRCEVDASESTLCFWRC